MVRVAISGWWPAGKCGRLTAMRMRDDFTEAAASTVRQIESHGYAVTVHHMREYVELHAVHLNGDGVPRVARCEGDGDAETYQAAKALAEMVGVHPGE